MADNLTVSSCGCGSNEATPTSGWGQRGGNLRIQGGQEVYGRQEKRGLKAVFPGVLISTRDNIFIFISGDVILCLL